MPFSMRTKINGESLSLCGDAKGGVSISSHFTDNELTVAFSSRNDLTVTGTGNLNATIIGGAENDRFDFSAATGNYHFKTGAGNDSVIDGTGNNTFDGGAGLDNFTFASEGGATPEVDTINHYVVTDDDIDISTGAATVSNVFQTDVDTVTIVLNDGDQIIVNSDTPILRAQIAGQIDFLV
jgi:Ca2+-binding RTX toxin-like protein